MKFKKQKIQFEFNGKNHKFSFVPKFEDYWTSFESHGIVFDVNYDVDYGFIVVYEVINGSANVKTTIYKQDI